LAGELLGAAKLRGEWGGDFEIIFLTALPLSWWLRRQNFISPKLLKLYFARAYNTASYAG